MHRPLGTVRIHVIISAAHDNDDLGKDWRPSRRLASVGSNSIKRTCRKESQTRQKLQIYKWKNKVYNIIELTLN